MTDDLLGKKTSAIVFAVGLYWIVSISMVFINKYLLSSSDLKHIFNAWRRSAWNNRRKHNFRAVVQNKIIHYLEVFDAPLFITWYQCLISFAICAALAFLSKARPNLVKFPSCKIDLKIARDILPLSLVFCGMITFNNLCLKNVSISFYMVVRSLTTVCNVLLTYLFFYEKTSVKALGCCGLIILGFILGIDQEKGLGTLSFSGVFYGIMASFFVALNAIYTKKSLNAVDNNIWKLTIYNNFNAIFIFLPLIFIFGEHSEVISFHYAFSYNVVLYFWFAMSISGVLGFSMSYVTSLQIQVTSPLTHNVSGTAKAYVQTLLGVMYYNEIKTTLWWFSNLLVLIGAALYSHVRGQEMKAKHKQAPELPVNAKETGINTDEDSTDKNSLLKVLTPNSEKN